MVLNVPSILTSFLLLSPSPRQLPGWYPAGLDLIHMFPPQTVPMVLFSWNSQPILSAWLTHILEDLAQLSLSQKLSTLTTGNWDLPALPQVLMSTLTHAVSSFSSLHLCSKVRWDLFHLLAYYLLSVPLYKREKTVFGLKLIRLWIHNSDLYLTQL